MARPKSEIGAEERRDIFAARFDADIDPSQTLQELVRAAGEYLERIIGPDAVAEGMATMLGMPEDARGAGDRPDWRDWLEEESSGWFSTWPLGMRLHDLYAYGRYGIVLRTEDADADPEMDDDAWLEARVTEVVAFRDTSPLTIWLSETRSPQLEEVILLAEGRWAIDNDKPVDPRALALLGEASEGRIRNLMAGVNRRLTRDSEGKIPAHEALDWLAGREGFWPSVWREQPIRFSTESDGPPLSAPVFVPVARDGTVFNPGLQRAGTYTVGPKGDEVHLEDFGEALSRLHAMSAPYWRRPNDQGAWGIVRGVRWERLERSELEGYRQNPRRRLVVAG